MEDLETNLLDVRLRLAIEDGLSPRVVSQCYGVSLEHATNVYWQTQQDLNAKKIAFNQPQVSWHKA